MPDRQKQTWKNCCQASNNTNIRNKETHQHLPKAVSSQKTSRSINKRLKPTLRIPRINSTILVPLQWICLQISSASFKKSRKTRRQFRKDTKNCGLGTAVCAKLLSSLIIWWRELYVNLYKKLSCFNAAFIRKDISLLIFKLLFSQLNQTKKAKMKTNGRKFCFETF